ncbi:unnamed protein product [Ceratitis capitata]|uniref:(Mediterranean fruit fly) hypothetical protein n=1 Tax=Ceratitis capitata TaxID=7213 RepID=A0A811UZ52_CERCA|nr:unnamed protein product [Ceratitis capitata]
MKVYMWRVCVCVCERECDCVGKVSLLIFSAIQKATCPLCTLKFVCTYECVKELQPQCRYQVCAWCCVPERTSGALALGTVDEVSYISVHRYAGLDGVDCWLTSIK